MNEHQGTVYENVLSEKTITLLIKFFDVEFNDRVDVGQLFFLKHPEILEEIQTAIPAMKDYDAYHDLLFHSKAGGQPIAWHNGTLSLAPIHDPLQSCSIWFPLSEVSEENGGRMVLLDSMQHAYPAFFYHRYLMSRGLDSRGESYNRFITETVLDTATTAKTHNVPRRGALKFNSLNVHRAEEWKLPKRRQTYAIRFIKKTTSFRFFPTESATLLSMKKTAESGRIDARVEPFEYPNFGSPIEG